MSKRHVYILKMPKSFKLDFNTLNELIYDNFYIPNSKDILIRWLDWVDLHFDKIDYEKIYFFLNKYDRLQIILNAISGHMIQKMKPSSDDKFSMATYVECDNINEVISNIVFDIMAKEGYA